MASFNQAIERIKVGCKGIHCRECLLTKDGRTLPVYEDLCDALSELSEE